MTHYHETFLVELQKHSTHSENYISEWVYAGTNDDDGLCNYFFEKVPDQTLPTHREKCICTHPIRVNCYIYNMLNKTVLVVGNCCIRKFLDDDKQRKTCAHCGKAHRNRKDDYCSECRELDVVQERKRLAAHNAEGASLLGFGKNKSRTFKQVFDEDQRYCDWCLQQQHPSYQMYSFRRWLYKEYAKSRLP